MYKRTFVFSDKKAFIRFMNKARISDSGRSLAQIANINRKKLEAEKNIAKKESKAAQISAIIPSDKLKKVSSISRSFERSWGTGKLYSSDAPKNMMSLLSKLEFSGSFMEDAIDYGGFTKNMFKHAFNGLDATNQLIGNYSTYFTNTGIKYIKLANDIFKLIVANKQNIPLIDK